MTGINTMPVTPRTCKTLTALVNTANTDHTGATGTVAQFKSANTNYTSGADGAYLGTLRIKSTVTTTDGNVRIYISDGTTKWLVEEIDITAVTVAAGTNGFSSVTALNLPIPASYTVHATTHNSEAMHITIDCWEY